MYKCIFADLFFKPTLKIRQEISFFNIRIDQTERLTPASSRFLDPV